MLSFTFSPLSQFYVPYARTFWSQNARTKDVSTWVNETLEDGNVTLTEVVEKVPEERIIKYLPHGNYKWFVRIVFLSLFANLIPCRL